ncbi:class I SAM-dependent methyltransferase [Jatrophihabitans sp. YIM 134969]
MSSGGVHPVPGPPPRRVAAAVTRDPTAQHDTVRANRGWWDAEAADYHREHLQFLGAADFVWGPEGLREDDVHLLGPLADLDGARVLEIGAGAAMCSRWLRERGVDAVASDLSAGMLAEGLRLSATTGIEVPLVQADAAVLPLASGVFDVVFSSYGAVPFVADSAAVLAEMARVLRPGGRCVFSTTHPVRWAFPDSPGRDGLVAGGGGASYFDRRPYVEVDADGVPVYAEHHRTLGDRVREISAAGLHLVDLVEPEWPAENRSTWGAWSPLRGATIPGTAVYVCVKPAS